MVFTLGVEDTPPPQPQIFNAITDPQEPDPRWEYIEEKREGSAVVARYYTYPRTRNA